MYTGVKCQGTKSETFWKRKHFPWESEILRQWLRREKVLKTLVNELRVRRVCLIDDRHVLSEGNLLWNSQNHWIYEVIAHRSKFSCSNRCNIFFSQVTRLSWIDWSHVADLVHFLHLDYLHYLCKLIIHCLHKHSAPRLSFRECIEQTPIVGLHQWKTFITPLWLMRRDKVVCFSWIKFLDFRVGNDLQYFLRSFMTFSALFTLIFK